MALLAVPLIGYALPAATAASFAYLDAKYMLSHDLGFVWQALRVEYSRRQREKTGRHNPFYVLEEVATNPKTADRAFIINEGKTWSYKQTYEVVLLYGTWLKERFGVQSGEVVSLNCTNCANYVFLWFGIWSIGAKAGLINYNITDKPLLHSIKTSTCRVILVDKEVEGNFPADVLNQLDSNDFRDGQGNVQVVFFTDNLVNELSGYKAVRQPDSERNNVTGPDMGMLIYTSGTTGLPKPAIISWNKVHGVRLFVERWLKLKPEDRFFTCMPLYHSAGALLATCVVMTTPCTLVIGKRFSPRTFWPTCRENGVTIIQYVGETCRYLLAAPPSPLDRQNSVRQAFGNGLRPEIWNKFKERFGIQQINEFYGATEGTGSTWNRSANDFSLGAMGRRGPLLHWFSGGSLVLVPHNFETEEPYRDEKTGFCPKIDTSKLNSPPGELLFLLPEDQQERDDLFPGYLGNKKASSEKVLRDVLKKGDAYFRTGDLVKIDPEGRIYFSDRIGDTFRWKSENVSTNEVGEVVSDISGIEEANVYGVEVPNHDGRAGCAAIVLKSGATDPGKQMLNTMASRYLAKLPRYSVPIFLRFTPFMQKTGTNKHQKKHLVEQGCDPQKVNEGSEGNDRMYWMQKGQYVRYGDKEFEQLKQGNIRL